MSARQRKLSAELQAAADLYEQNGIGTQEVDIDWTAGLRTNSNGRFYGDESNVLHALRNAPELRGCVRFNEFSNRAEIARPVQWRKTTIGEQWADVDDLDVMAWLQQADIPVRSRVTVADSIARVARDTLHHPVREYLDSLEWDGVSRLRMWLQHYLGADADPQYLTAIGTAFLISAVARIFEPGCQADHVLVLEGRQGIGKTRTLQTLGDPWTTDSLPDLHSKDAAVQLHGVWLVELAELAALRRSEIEVTKAFITRRVDRYRPHYGRHAIEIPRQCVFVATTNEATYLRDPTGNRRFWPVRVTKTDIDALARDRGKLWGEAVNLYRQGASWYLTGNAADRAAEEQDKRVDRTELEQCVMEFLDDLEERGVVEISTREVYTRALGLVLPEDADKARRMGTAVNQAFNVCGWHRIGPKGRGQQRRIVYVKGETHSRSQ